MNPREPPHCLKKVTIGARVILSPTGISLRPISPGAIERSKGCGRIHQTSEGELGLLGGVGGERKIVVLDGRIFAEGELEGEQGSGESDGSACKQDASHIQRIAPAANLRARACRVSQRGIIRQTHLRRRWSLRAVLGLHKYCFSSALAAYFEERKATRWLQQLLNPGCA